MCYYLSFCTDVRVIEGMGRRVKVLHPQEDRGYIPFLEESHRPDNSQFSLGSKRVGVDGQHSAQIPEQNVGGIPIPYHRYLLPF